MHHLRSRLHLLAAFATLVVTGCFSPELPATITCGEDGSCPPGLRCETSANICVDPSQAGVSELHFDRQPITVEAGVDAPEVVVQLRDAAGHIVPVTGGTFAIELETNDAGVNLLGSVIHPASRGVIRFDALQLDRPGHGLRLVVHGGDLSATSEPFDVTTTRPAILAVSTGGIIDSCATVTYQLQQAQSLPVDVLVEFDPDGPMGPLPFRRATQAPSAPGKAGVHGVAGAPQGRSRTFTWNTTADVPGVDSAGELRITPSMGGVPGKAFSTPMTVSNGPRFIAVPVGGNGYRDFRYVDLDGDGRLSGVSFDPSTHALNVDGAATFPIPEAETVRDVEVADLDGDALLDLAVSLSTRTVVALQQRGPDHHFGAGVEIGGSFLQLTTADLDHDGLADLIGIEAATSDVVILRASRAAPQIITEVARPWRGGDTGRVLVADLDRDGWDDLVIGRASASGAVAVVRNTVVGLAAPTTELGLTGHTIAVADLDGDGRDDVASLDATGLHVAGAGGRVDFPGITGQVLALHDVDGDTLPDVVTATADHVYLRPHVTSRLQLAFGPAVLVGPALAATGFFIGDYDLDGRIDIYTPIEGNDLATEILFVSSMPRRCNARLAGPVTSRSNAIDANWGVFADVNGDGKTDYVSMAGGFQSHTQIVADLGLGDGSFVDAPDPLHEFRDGSTLRGMTAVDLDGDGAVDVAVADAASHAISLLYNDAAAPGTFFGVDVSVPLPQAFGVADLDGDGALDLVVLDTGRVQIRRGDPASKRQFGEPQVLPTVVDTTDELGWCRWTCELHVSDLDADGDQDILVVTKDKMFLFLADASEPLGYAEPVAFLDSQYLVDVVDLLGDGRPEVLVMEPSADSDAHLVAYDLKANGASVEKVWDSPIATTTVPIDLDGDGHKELLVRTADGLAKISPGSAEPLQRLEPTFFLGANDLLATADVDSDGHDDIVVTSYGRTIVIRVDEHGPVDLGTRLSARGIAESGGYGNELALGDFSGDGLLDLATRDSVAHTITLATQASDRPGTMAADERTLPGWNFSGLADLDGDRRADLITYGNDGSLVFLDPTGAGPVGLCRSPVSAFPFAVADIIRDGRMDLVVTSDTDVLIVSAPADACVPPISVMSLDRPGVPHWYPEGLVVADMNRDGLLDVVVGTNALRVALQRPDAPGTFDVSDYETNNDPNAWPYRDLTVADLDGDGDLDVVVIGEDSGIKIFGNAGRGTLEPSELVPESTSYAGRSSVSVADVNGDGRLDIVTGGPRSTDVFLQIPDRYNRATGVFAFAYDTLGAQTDDYDAERAILVDFDSDGRNDVVYVDPAQGTMLLRGR